MTAANVTPIKKSHLQEYLEARADEELAGIQGLYASSKLSLGKHVPDSPLFEKMDRFNTYDLKVPVEVCSGAMLALLGILYIIGFVASHPVFTWFGYICTALLAVCAALTFVLHFGLRKTCHCKEQGTERHSETWNKIVRATGDHIRIEKRVDRLLSAAPEDIEVYMLYKTSYHHRFPNRTSHQLRRGATAYMIQLTCDGVAVPIETGFITH